MNAEQEGPIRQREIIDGLNNYILTLDKKSILKESCLVIEQVASSLALASRALELTDNESDKILISAALSIDAFSHYTESPSELVSNYFNSNQKYIGYKQEVMQLVKDAKAERFKSEMVSLISDLKNSIYASQSLFEAAELLYYDEFKPEGSELTDENWYNHLNQKLRSITFKTKYGSNAYTGGVEKNLLLVSKSLKKIEKKKDSILQKNLKIDEQELKELKKKYSKIAKRAERGTETLFRLTSKNHYTLNTMVDRKAGILISINSIILSIILGTLLNKVSEDPHLIAPIIMILTTNILSIVYAIIATRPELTHGESKELSGNHELLFYGNFINLDAKSYVAGMNGLINNADKLYESISMDIYYMGRSLKKKFNSLRWSFNIFMYGLILSVLAFLGCHMIFETIVAF